MILTANARSVPGTLRTEILVDGRFRLTTDEPPSIGGEDTAPAPHELLPAALAACASTTLELYARTKGWDLGQIVVDVDYEPTSVPRRCEVRILLDGPLTAGQVERLEKVAASCPVQRAIEGGIVIDEQIELSRKPLADAG